MRNLKASVDAVKKAGKHAQGAICYSPESGAHDPGVLDIAQQIKELGCDSICVQDVDGLLKPQAAYDLVKGIKQKCGSDTLVSVHTHSTTGVTMVSLMKAIEAGCDIVDTAISSLGAWVAVTIPPRAWSRCWREPASSPVSTWRSLRRVKRTYAERPPAIWRILQSSHRG